MDGFTLYTKYFWALLGLSNKNLVKVIDAKNIKANFHLKISENENEIKLIFLHFTQIFY